MRSSPSQSGDVRLGRLSPRRPHRSRDEAPGEPVLRSGGLRQSSRRVLDHPRAGPLGLVPGPERAHERGRGTGRSRSGGRCGS